MHDDDVAIDISKHTMNIAVLTLVMWEPFISGNSIPLAIPYKCNKFYNNTWVQR